MNSNQKAKLVEITTRIQMVQGGIAELLKKNLLAVDPAPQLLESDTREVVDKAMEHCEKAEKLVNEGKVFEAMKEEKKCTELLGTAAAGG